MQNEKAKILFFDGVCVLCNRSVRFLLRHDRAHIICFAPLQGITAAVLLHPEAISKLSGVVYLRHGMHYEKSDAVIRVLRDLGFPWNIAVIGKIIPLRVRNYFYDRIAKSRYERFGKLDQCAVVSGSDKKYFLD